MYLISKRLYYEVFKLHRIKETKPLLLPNQYVKSRENVIGRGAITRDKCIYVQKVEKSKKKAEKEKIFKAFGG